MKTLEQIKEEYVMDKFLASHELDTWIDFQNYFASRHPEWFEQHFDEVAKIYADECAKESLRLASERATIVNKFGNDIGHYTFDSNRNKIWVNKQSILSESNLPNHE